jgi:hypothetical protein
MIATVQPFGVRVVGSTLNYHVLAILISKPHDVPKLLLAGNPPQLVTLTSITQAWPTQQVSVNVEQP